MDEFGENRQMPSGRTPVLSVVIPIYNEQDALPFTVERLRTILDGMGVSYEVVGVDDGSTDATAGVLARFRAEWPQLRVITFRRTPPSGGRSQPVCTTPSASTSSPSTPTCRTAGRRFRPCSSLALAQKLDVVYGVRSDRSTDTVFQAGHRGPVLPP